jgi:cytochrome c oxidase assembly factor CtaG/putative copper export protein
LNLLLRPVPLLFLLIGVPFLAMGLLWLNGALVAGVSPDLGDPGRLTLWGLPAARGVRDVTAALTVGLLVLAAVAVPPTPRSDIGDLGLGQVRMLNLAAATGGVWVWSTLAILALTYSNVAGLSLSAPGAMRGVSYFATSFEAGQLLLVSATTAGATTVGCLFVRRFTAVGILVLVSLAALWPLALSGHAAGATDHDLAVNAQAVHLIAVSVWVGGLATLYLTRKAIGSAFPTVVSRYSAIAGGCYVAVLASGALAATLRLDEWRDLGTSYGLLLVAKAASLALLGLAGWTQRRRILPRLGDEQHGGGWFTRLAGIELMLMAAALGAAVALGATPPPVPERPLSTAESLLGHPLPSPVTAGSWFTSWQMDTFWAPLTLAATVAYVVGVRRLRARGDRWPIGRTVSWLIGAAGLGWATSGAPGVYGDVLFSMHMVQHMTIATAVPAFLCLSAPVTLALRALSRRSDGSRGAREWLLVLVHSRLMRLFGHPLVAAALFIVGLVVFYYSPLFELSLRSHTAHLLMVGHFLFTGYLFASVICGIDPGVRRPAYPLRMLLLMVTFGFHAFFSVSLMSSTTVLARGWFLSLGREWGATLERDQYVGASLGWALGDYPLAILGGALIWNWVRADHQEGRRLDRQADRDDDAQLRQYNDYLDGLRSSSDRRSGPRQ